jgi:putative ABC transport system ATP-binding protein
VTENDNILTAHGLEKSYGKGPARVEVLRGLDLSVRRGEFLAVMGPSGCGKSTLLHILGLITPPDTGRVEMDGRPVPPNRAGRNLLRRRYIGMVFQRFNLISVLSAADNVAISLRVRGMAGRDDAYVETLLQEMGVAHVRDRKPGAMSIGEQQRVAVVRAMAHRPALLLADEPTGNLDSANAERLMELFRKINLADKQTIIMITHSAEAAGYADRVVQMKDGRLL